MASAGDVADEIDRMEAEMHGSLHDEELLTIGNVALNTMVLRTRRGVDVNHQPFAPYSHEYLVERRKAGYSTTPDLVRTGHMQQALTVKVGHGEASVEYMNEREAIKALVHDQGVNKRVSVRAHRRKTAVDLKTGRRVSTDEARRDKRRKVKRTGIREESVSVFERQQRTPQREHFGIEHRDDEQLISDAVQAVIEKRFTGKIK